MYFGVIRKGTLKLLGECPNSHLIRTRRSPWQGREGVVLELTLFFIVRRKVEYFMSNNNCAFRKDVIISIIEK